MRLYVLCIYFGITPASMRLFNASDAEGVVEERRILFERVHGWSPHTIKRPFYWKVNAAIKAAANLHTFTSFNSVKFG